MEDIASYISIIEPRLLKHISGKPKEFIRIYQSEKFLSEDAFMVRICGEKHGRSYYSDLKSRTVKILQAMTFISTPKGVNPVKKKYDLCQKKFLLGQKFLNKGTRKEGIRLVRQAHLVAMKYDFVHLACELSSILYHEHVYYNRNKKKTKYYAALVEHYLNDYTVEKKAEHCFYQIIELMGTSSIKINELEDIVGQVSALEGKSIKFAVYKATVHVLLGLHKGEHQLVIHSCTQALQSFKNKKGVYTSHYHFFLKIMGLSYMSIGEYHRAQNNFEQAATFAPTHTINDYMIRFYKTLNALHSGSYQVAYDLYKQNRKCRNEHVRLQFAIIEGYLYFLAHSGYLPLEKPFRLGKYLNDTFKAQKDKQGDNINILIAELLVLLSRNRGRFIDRIEAVQNYTYRHLKDTGAKRAKWFIKILCLLPSTNFHPINLSRKAKRYISLLEDNPIQMGENFAIEIIPFENLLQMIIEQLGRKAA